MNSLQVCCFLLLAVGSYALGSTSDPCVEKTSCLKDLLLAQQSKSMKKLCSALDVSGNCFQAMKTCNASMQKVMDSAEIKIDNDDMKFGCDGSCAQAADHCVSKVAGLINPSIVYNFTICQDITSSLKCLENLDTSKCKKNIKTMLKYFAEATKTKEFSDYCGKDGQQTSCAKNLEECMDNISNLGKKTPVKQACLAMEKYLQCESSDNCKDVLKEKKMDIRKSMETMEVQAKCPTYGSCNDRVEKCAKPAMTAFNKYTDLDKHKSEICKDVMTSLKCFDFVKKDPVCINDKSAILSEETQIRQYSSKCDAAVGSYALGSTSDPCVEKTSCLKDLLLAQQSKSIKKLCSALDVSGNCFKAMKTCNASMQKVMDSAEIKIDNDDMQFGCDGSCAQAADHCVSKVAGLINPSIVYNFTICQDITSSLKCLENLDTSKCKKNIKTMLKYFAEATKTKEFSDYCGKDGQQTSCAKNLEECMDNISNLGKKTPVKQACLAMEKYLQCESSDNCKDVLKEKKMDIRKSMETMEVQAKCPTYGSCNDRVEKCAKPAMTAFNKYTDLDKHKSEICKDVMTTLKCFDFVKKDPVCINDKSAILSEETQIRQYSSKCDAASFFVSSALLVVGVVTSVVKNYL